MILEQSMKNSKNEGNQAHSTIEIFFIIIRFEKYRKKVNAIKTTVYLNR